MKRFECFMLDWTGRIIIAGGFVGVIVIANLDAIRGRPFEMDWMQIAGMMLCGAIMLFGEAVHKFHQTIKSLLDN